MGLMDNDFALLEPKPTTSEESSSPAVISKYDKWESANNMSLMLIKRSTSDSIRGSILDRGNAKDFHEYNRQKNV